MKKYLLIIIAIFFFKTSFSQVYQSFPTANAMWREYSGGYQCSCCADFQYTITGDTVINTMTYHKIQKTGVRYWEDLIGNCTSNIQSIINNYAGCFREDIGNKKIFFVPPMTSSDTLLYDFNLSLGDTLPPLYVNNIWLPTTNIVTAIDSILLDAVYHKRFTIDSCWHQLYLIEGIGSTYGLLSNTYCPFEAIYTLQCFSIDSQTIYPDNSTICSLITSINNFEQETSIKIFPNPANDKIIVELNNSQFHNSFIELINLLGKKVKDLKLLDNTSKAIISVEDLHDGIYFYRINNDGVMVKSGRILILK